MFTFHRRSAALLCVLTLPVPLQPLSAQQVLGQVRDEATGNLVVGAVVTARSATGDLVAYALSNDLGEYALSLPEAGTYTFDAESVGYGRLAASDISIEEGLPVLLHFELGPAPIELEGISAEAASRRAVDLELQRVGLGLGDVLETRIVTRNEIAEHQSSRDVGAVLEWQNIAGTKLIRSQNFSGNAAPILCLSQLRGRTAMGMDRCSIAVLNGNPITLASALDIHPDDVDSIVVLTPVQATLVYGTAGGGGAVLIYTRSGRE